MTHPRLNQNREDQAHQELGITSISRPMAWLLTLAFLLILILPTTIQTIHEVLVKNVRPGVFQIAQTPLTATDLKNLETNLENQSIVQETLLPWIQPLFLAVGAAGEKVIPGRDDWLFFERDVSHLTGSGFMQPSVMLARRRAGDRSVEAVQPDSIEAIVDFRDQLAKRGIELVLLPTPVKPEVHPERLSARLDPDVGVLANPSMAAWFKALEAEGIHAFDLHELMVQIKRASSEPLYLRQDTHWTPRTVERVADHVADWIERNHEDMFFEFGAEYASEPREVVNHGDIFDMLALDERRRGRYQPERFEIRRITPATDDDADDQRNDDPIPSPEGRSIVVRGRIVEAVRPPSPGSVPYPDAVTATLLTDVQPSEAFGTALPEGRMVVYAMGMSRNRWTAAAEWQPGRTIEIRLRPWADVRQAYGAINRFDLVENEDAMFELPLFWAEPVGQPDDESASEAAPIDQWRPDTRSPILLLGDSFTNIFSRKAMGWGDSAGLAEQLAYELALPLDVIAINGGGALASRQALAADLARGEDRLAGKRLVIWQFATRELSQGDWRLLNIRGAQAQRGEDEDTGETP
ncbi:MAG: hypothetical protein JJU36_15030 [Phycisphaeraceae bacterium]|nr:hypothetical protein [Phycisphaeraceae bacterium]